MALDEWMKYGNIGVVLISLVMIASSGLFFGFIYWGLDNIQTGFEGSDCEISGNDNWATCQEMLEDALYPFLEMRDILIWWNILFIFVLVIAMLLLGYQTGFKPWTIGLLAIFELLLTYGSIYIANIYRVFVSNETIRDMLTEFTVYNRVMMNFPWFVFVVSLFSIALGLVNWQRSRVNDSASDLNY